MRYLYYLNVKFYRFYIGREEQSVNEKVMISRIDQQLTFYSLLMENGVACEIIIYNDEPIKDFSVAAYMPVLSKQ